MKSDQDRPEQIRLQREADRARPRSKVSVLGYITILFGAAFLLLLMAYFMQQRSNERVISGLKESVSAMQSIDNLQEQNDSLSAQVDQLQQNLQQKSAELADAHRSQAEQEKQLSALDWLREIQALYNKKYYRAAREMIAEFEATGLAASLPNESLHVYDESDVLSPLEQYNQIVDALN
jgi:septal ring factor EnvC (AmiA/AmiB activator)